VMSECFVRGSATEAFAQVYVYFVEVQGPPRTHTMHAARAQPTSAYQPYLLPLHMRASTSLDSHTPCAVCGAGAKNPRFIKVRDEVMRSVATALLLLEIPIPYRNSTSSLDTLLLRLTLPVLSLSPHALPVCCSAVHPMAYWSNDESTCNQWLDGGFRCTMDMAVKFGGVQVRGLRAQPSAANRSVGIRCVGLDLFNLSCCAGCGERQSAIPGRVTVLPSRSVRDLIVCTGSGRAATVSGGRRALESLYFAEV
jgi:hypothetical protein